MKCKNCGADYRTRELKCPYCGTENAIGKIWLIERQEADRELEQAKRSGGMGRFLYVADKVMNRILLISVILFLLLAAAAMILSAGESAYKSWYKKTHIKEMEQTMQELYESRKFEELYDYMDDHDLFSKEYYAYSQSCFINYDYQCFKTYMLMFLSLSEEDQKKWPYLLENALKYSVDVYSIDAGLYSEETPVNQELYRQFRLEIMSFWKGMLGMSEEEIKLILDETFRFYGPEKDKLMETLMERRAWE